MNFFLGVAIAVRQDVDRWFGGNPQSPRLGAHPCIQCCGRGWYPEIVPGTENDYIPDSIERYCDCPRGRWKAELGI